MTFLKPKVIIPVAILIGAIATFSVYAYLQKQKQDVKPATNIQTTPVVSALLPLVAGAQIQEKDLRVTDWPSTMVPVGTFSDVTKLIGRVVKIDIAENEPIFEAKLAQVGSQEGFSSLIPTGMRAMTVQVNVYSGVSGFILPGANVDVLVTVSSAGSGSEASTRIILENVKVLAVDQTFKTNDSDPVKVQSVTLLVTPGQAEKLALGTTEGKLLLMLRNASDQEASGTSGVQLDELTYKRPEPVRHTIVQKQVVEPPKEEPKSTVVEVIRSSKKEEVKFEEKKK
jgi:pilus assembly protein CpaB